MKLLPLLALLLSVHAQAQNPSPPIERGRYLVKMRRLRPPAPAPSA